MRRWRTGAVVAICLWAPSGLCAPVDGSTPVRLASVPARPADAPTGSQFLAQTTGLPDVERQRAAVREIERGNMPHFLDSLTPVQLSYQVPDGESIAATVWVTPDYLAVGSDDDFFYASLSRRSASLVADRFDCVLPTPRIVDAIYDQAQLRMKPQPLPPGPAMRSNAYLARHQQLIGAQRAGMGFDALISGHKKDLVLTDRLLARPDRVAIYGWHRSSGHPIQPLSTVHGARYADYSHGVRLVWHEVVVNDERRSIYDVLADPRLAPVLSSEGALHDPRALMDPERIRIGTFAADLP